MITGKQEDNEEKNKQEEEQAEMPSFSEICISNGQNSQLPGIDFKLLGAH